MTIKHLILVLFFTNPIICFSQKKEFNVIISVDNNLSNVYAKKFVLVYENDSIQTLKINFKQGRLMIDDKDYEKLLSENLRRIDLYLSYIEVCGDNIETYKYEIVDFKLPWLLKGAYFILYIYNTNKKEYKNIYSPLPGKEFTFEYDWEGIWMRRVQKKLTKKQRKCKQQ